MKTSDSETITKKSLINFLQENGFCFPQSLVDGFFTRFSSTEDIIEKKQLENFI